MNTNCSTIVNIIKYSPKRKAVLEKVKHIIDSCQRTGNKPQNVYASLKPKIFDFYVTQWIVRADSTNGISEGSAVKIYWRGLYLQGFDTIIEDLNAKLLLEQYKFCAEIEVLLLNSIT